MMIPTIDPEQRAAISRELVRLGCDFLRANIIVDLACQAAEDAMATIWRKTNLAPDRAVFHSAYDLALAFAGMLIAGGLVALQLGAWIIGPILILLGAVIVAILANDEFLITIGPIGVLRVGQVWSIDLIPAKRGIYGIGLNPRRWRFRKVRG